jgi:hypothetical protein
MEKITPINKNLLLIPIIGSIIFIILFIIATQYYPGGSQANKNSVGFSWLHNYWCNLLHPIAINGLPNPAQPFMMTAMFLLCGSLMVFWGLFPNYLHINKPFIRLSQITGILAMLMVMLIFTTWHDTLLNIAGVLILVCLTIVYIGLYKNKWYLLFNYGIINLIILAFNNYLYYCTNLFYLPIVQKISVFIFLGWIILSCNYVYKKNKLSLHRDNNLK